MKCVVIITIDLSAVLVQWVLSSSVCLSVCPCENSETVDQKL